VLRTFFNSTADAAAALAAFCGAPQANRNDFQFFSATPEANSTNQSCDYIQPMAAAPWNGAVRRVKKVRKPFRRWGTLR